MGTCPVFVCVLTQSLQKGCLQLHICVPLIVGQGVKDGLRLAAKECRQTQELLLRVPLVGSTADLEALEP